MTKKKSPIKRFSLNNLPATKTDIAKLRAMSDKDIEKAVQDDPDAAPILDETWLKNAKPVFHKPVKPVVSLRLSPSTIEWYKKQGKGHSGFMAQILEHYAIAHMDDNR